MIENDIKIAKLRYMMKISEMVPYLKQKKIKFDKMSEEMQKNIQRNLIYNYFNKIIKNNYIIVDDNSLT